MSQIISLLEQSTGSNGQARLAAVRAMQEIEVQATSLVSYQSKGSVLIIAEPDTFETLKTKLGTLNCIHTPMVSKLDGHLGDFKAFVTSEKGEVNLALLKADKSESFDLILDLSNPPHWQREMQAFGYFAPKGEVEIQAALQQIADLQGEFEKPKFFEYSENLCAHSRRGIEACRRCLDACPAEAITSLAEKISVDPFLCQGGGTCATVCPTGAIRYAYPRLNDTLNRVRRMLQAYKEVNGTDATLLIHDGESGEEWLAQQLPLLGEHVLPFVVEEAGSVGMDMWLASLAFAAQQVVILLHPGQDKVKDILQQQMEYARALLVGMGYDANRIVLLDSSKGSDSLGHPDEFTDGKNALPIASFMLLDEKRYTLRSAIDHLYEHAPAQQEMVALPAGAPFGQVNVNIDKCTLCMACVSVCPAEALSDGNELPKLNFSESSCVQCGMCSKACPERAIHLESRYVYKSDWAQSKRTLHEEEPFCCTACGKPFATQSAIKVIQSKLNGHHMFQSEEQQRRLLMCEDCRVRDMFSNELEGKG
ncbi:MAG: 4Fe-4S binding protein [Gammaproteobacteria bacterium]|nr:4Fe-4S binding protein [Gammaproteobacteria bacterium]